MFDYKITDLKYHINSLMPKTVCDSFIKFYEDNNTDEYALPEQSYKFSEKKMIEDNYKCINLSKLKDVDDKFKKPLEIAKQYISIVVANYVLYIKNNICPTFSDNKINKTSNIRIIKYGVGDHIKDHIDVNLIERNSITINLNESYKGGEFRFFNGKVKESLKTGDAMIFPADNFWIHGTEPVSEGVRYSINCFLHP